MFREDYIFLHNNIERSIADLRCDDGNNISVLVDQITGVVKDVQDNWLVGVCQPMNSLMRQGKRMYALSRTLER